MLSHWTIPSRSLLVRLGLPLVIIADLIAVAIVRVNQPGLGLLTLALLASPMLVVVGLMAWWSHRTRRRFKTLVESDWRRCLYCFFDLRGLPDHGLCPECGRRFHLRDVREQWKDATASDRDEEGYDG